MKIQGNDLDRLMELTPRETMLAWIMMCLSDDNGVCTADESVVRREFHRLYPVYENTKKQLARKRWLSIAYDEQGGAPRLCVAAKRREAKLAAKAVARRPAAAPPPARPVADAAAN